MSGGVVCYIERSHGGCVLTRVRLMAIGLSRSWTAPESPEDGGDAPAAGSAEGGTALTGVRAAARWVAETLQSVGIKRLASVCVDADGSICAWLSAPSADPPVIRATIAQSEHDTDGHSGLGAGRLIALAAPGAASGYGSGSDTSVQALASPEVATATNGTSNGARRLLGRGSKNVDAAGALRRNRYAVLAIPDAPVRVFLDELDSRGIEVQAVTSLWHAMARAWTDPEEQEAEAGQIVSSSSPTSAVVIIEPGRGSGGPRGGELLAGGTMRLKCLPRRVEAPPVTTTDALATADARRVQREELPPEDEEMQIEFTQADAGRLAVDWLAWSAQLGHCPRRIVVVASPGATDEHGSGPASLGRHLSRAWPNATIDAAVFDQPTQATLGRLAGVRHGPQKGDDPPIPEAAAPEQSRAALVGLSSRRGRADRGMYRWAALGVAGAAVVVGVLGWRLRASAGDFAEREATTKKNIADLLTGIEPILPGVSGFRPNDQLATLEKKRTDLKELAKNVPPPHPVLEETVRVLKAFEGKTGIDITEFQVGFVNGNVTIEIPESATAADVGPQLLQKLQGLPGQLVWDGQSSSFSSPGKRRYSLIGFWPAPSNDAKKGTR